ncbi:hypothetical protein MGMO_177c00040 [Methyloglobulus morosus KoM1]|uniref:Secreted protein n=1 Tax=Methyloglobulus morosus KoM1 TaxID=1116472 RepID=V5BQ81_9GAMM|nr:hypothetical protein [Methyloglobulus morosus]ESS66713.1 hypothetical protein MGMO_177c00040 [Methyloglobulus morosus KoM1]
MTKIYPSIKTIMKPLLTLLATSLLVFSFNVSADNESQFEKFGHSQNKHDPDNLIKAMTFSSTRPFDSVDGTFF